MPRGFRVGFGGFTARVLGARGRLTAAALAGGLDLEGEMEEERAAIRRARSHSLPAPSTTRASITHRACVTTGLLPSTSVAASEPGEGFGLLATWADEEDGTCEERGGGGGGGGEGGGDGTRREIRGVGGGSSWESGEDCDVRSSGEGGGGGGHGSMGGDEGNVGVV